MYVLVPFGSLPDSLLLYLSHLILPRTSHQHCSIGQILDAGYGLSRSIATIN